MKNIHDKIVLIGLDSPWADEPAMNPPLSLCYLSAHLKNRGYFDIQGIDMAVLGHQAIDLRAQYYGITCLTPQYGQLVEVCDYIREYNPSAKIVVGGPHVTAIPDDLPKSANFVIRGDGERAFVDYVSRGTIPKKSIYREGFSPDLVPDRELFGLHNYHRLLNGEPAVHIVTLKGCPYSCSYCDTTSISRKVYFRDLDNVFAEIKYIKNLYNVNNFIIYDDIFTLDKDRVEEFCLRVAKLQIKFRCWARADTLNQHILCILRDAGLTQLTLGIESGSDAILTNINKGTTRKQNYYAMTLCDLAEIPIRCSLMFGNPGECKHTLIETLEMVEDCQPDEWNLAVLQPIPGSEVWQNPAKFDLKFDKAKLKRDNYVNLNRFADSGVGKIWYDYVKADKAEMVRLLAWFVRELERVCPRKKIQDTIQNIDVAKESYGEQ